MNIRLEKVGKRFNREWIFKGVDYFFEAGKAYAITGHNGSGKSTLLQVIAGSVKKTEGQITFSYNGKELPEEKNFSALSIAAPYLELIEEMTAVEFLNFHRTFKSLTAGNNQILTRVGLEKAAHKQIRYYSSGMKQRLKLAQAFYADMPVLLLDEPTTNLDAEGVALYHGLVTDTQKRKLILVCSNDPQEFSFCTASLNITGFKN